jgi:hypothetical protein
MRCERGYWTRRSASTVSSPRRPPPGGSASRRRSRRLARPEEAECDRGDPPCNTRAIFSPAAECRTHSDLDGAITVLQGAQPPEEYQCLPTCSAPTTREGLRAGSHVLIRGRRSHGKEKQRTRGYVIMECKETGQRTYMTQKNHMTGYG